SPVTVGIVAGLEEAVGAVGGLGHLLQLGEVHRVGVLGAVGDVGDLAVAGAGVAAADRDGVGAIGLRVGAQGNAVLGHGAGAATDRGAIDRVGEGVLTEHTAAV